MLDHPEIAATEAQAGEIAPNYPAPVVFAVLCAYVSNQEAGQKITNRVLLHRFKNPQDFSRPAPRECPGSNFYHDFKFRIGSFDTAPKAEASETQPDAQPDPPQVEEAPPPDKPPVNELAETIAEQFNILHHPRSTPDEKETARAAIRRTVREERQEQQRLGGTAGTRGAHRCRREGGSNSDDSQGAHVSERASKARLRELLKSLPAEVANPFAREGTARAKDIQANDRITDAERERRIEVLELEAITAIENQGADTTTTETAAQDTEQADHAPPVPQDAPDSDGNPPAADPQPDPVAQAQDAEKERRWEQMRIGRRNGRQDSPAPIWRTPARRPVFPGRTAPSPA